MKNSGLENIGVIRKEKNMSLCNLVILVSKSSHLSADRLRGNEKSVDSSYSYYLGVIGNFYPLI